MADHDWSRFLLRIPINADREIIFHSISSPEGLESWFLRKANFTSPDGKPVNRQSTVSPGDKYEWYWHGWPDDVVENGEVLAFNGNNRFAFTFGNAGQVTFTIKTEKGQLIVELLQDRIPTTEEGQIHYHLGCTKGWLFYLTNLKSILE